MRHAIFYAGAILRWIVSALWVNRKLCILALIGFAGLHQMVGNALHQNGPHPSPWLQTRERSGTVAESVEDGNERAASPAAERHSSVETAESDAGAGTDAAPLPFTGDPAILRIQEVLSQLGLYDGALDGQDGPQTRQAIAHYQRIVGLPQTGEADAQFRSHLRGRSGGQSDAGEAITARTVSSTGMDGGAMTPAAADRMSTGSVPDDPAKRAELIQAGLKRFGHEELTVDGIWGPQSRDAVLSFQSLFGLPQTGEPDAQTLATLRRHRLVEN